MKKLSRKRSEEILEKIKKAGDAKNYETFWNEKGVPVSKEKKKIKKGKISKARGTRFELKVREDLENKNYTVDKWSNNVDLEKGKIVSAKRKFNPYSRVMTIGTGFPDFIAIKHIHDEVYSVIGVECKINGKLSKTEKTKCAFYLKNKIFSSIWIAKQGEKRGTIQYDDFKEKYGKNFL
ncbi:MAG: hypothetical protein PVJ67_00475 [Candidatus Pacearchaeota archaeon]|jgi:hypothetical protein